METGFKTGFYVSGGLHGAMFLWLAIGGLFFAREVEPIPVTDVSIISGAQFMAMQPSGPEPVEDVDDAPAPPVVDAAPEVETPDAPEIAAPAAALETPTPPTPEPIAAPELPEPPSPAPDTTLAPGVDAAPEVSEETAPAPEAAPRVADDAAPAPEPDVAIDDVDQAAAAPDADSADIVEDAQEETAQQEATTEIVTEAEERPSLAPTASVRPTARPNRPPPPAVVAEDDPIEEPTPQVAQDDDADDLDRIASALESALQDEQTEQASSESTAVDRGPPLTSGETDGFRAQINKCWSVGSLSSEAQQSVVTVGFDMQRGGKPDFNSLELLSSDGPNDAAIALAFRQARSAIVRCGQDGYTLPDDKYEQWREVEVTFDARSEQIR